MLQFTLLIPTGFFCPFSSSFSQNSNMTYCVVTMYYKPFFLHADIHLHQLCEIHSIRTAERGQLSRRGLGLKYKPM